jgi:hypothetical protein
MKMLKQFLLACVLVFSTAESGADTEPDAEVLLFGVFHFANPGLDVVKTSQKDVMTAENQKFLAGLTDRLAAFKPTVVLLEFNPDNGSLMQEKYEQYLAGDFELPSNEIYQLGFRIANKAGLRTVHSFDEREIGWQAEELFAYMPDHDPATKAKMDLLIEQITSETQQDHATKSLADLLLLSNDPERDQLNKYFYIMTNHVGAGDNFVGADAAASWWHRNFRMYANIQKHAAPGARVLAIGGQGHMAILKDLLALDRERIAVDVRPYIADQ